MATQVEAHDFSPYDSALWPQDALAADGLRLYVMENEDRFNASGDILFHMTKGYVANYVINGWEQYVRWPRDFSIDSLTRIYGPCTVASAEELFEMVRHTLYWAIHHLDDPDWQLDEARHIDPIRDATRDLEEAGVSYQ